MDDIAKWVNYLLGGGKELLKPATKPVAVSRGSRQQLLPTAYCPLATREGRVIGADRDGGGGSRLC